MPLKLLLLSLFLIFSCDNPTESSCVKDPCGVCNGDGSTCEVDDGQAVDDGQKDIYYQTSIPIAGFEFIIDGVDVLDAIGGAAETAGFTVNTNSTTGVVLGFSLSGAAIPAGEGVLVTLNISGFGNACIIESGLVIADLNAQPLSASVVDCNLIQID